MYDWTLYVVLDISTSIPGIQLYLHFFASEFEL